MLNFFTNYNICFIQGLVKYLATHQVSKRHFPTYHYDPLAKSVTIWL
ncbi:hypothetical protein Patl1_17354 [Pistacia atlantica]|uniref:Uncharacterized protein n=1 Tax=Pistacia atlantica TaxID=434234 RepID=A0ACC1BYR5_9ROSI|nr:hypothetical protein Patl1_17354 [Pistacia atlantica]